MRQILGRVKTGVLTVALALVIGLPPGQLRAEEVSGRIYLGDGLRLYVESGGSLFSHVLGAFNLGEIRSETFCLDDLLPDGESLFIGRDLRLYHRSPAGLVAVGEARDPFQIHLSPGAQLDVEFDGMAPFTGTGRARRLKVRPPAGSAVIPTPSPSPAVADFNHWVSHLDELLGEQSVREGHTARMLFEVLLSCLPRTAPVTAPATECLKQLQAVIEARRVSHRAMVKELVRRVRREAASHQAEAGEANDGESARLLRFYGDLEKRLR